MDQGAVGGVEKSRRGHERIAVNKGGRSGSVRCRSLGEEAARGRAGNGEVECPVSLGVVMMSSMVQKDTRGISPNMRAYAPESAQRAQEQNVGIGTEVNDEAIHVLRYRSLPRFSARSRETNEEKRGLEAVLVGPRDTGGTGLLKQCKEAAELLR